MSHEQTQEALRQEWGQEYRMNLSIARNYLEGAPEGVAQNLFGARLADGTLLGNNADVLNWLVEQARTINPVASVMPQAHGDPGKAMADEIKELETEMKDLNSDYYKNEAKQARYRELIDARMNAA